MGLMKYVLAVFLSLSLLSVSMVRSQNFSCPTNTSLSSCRKVLENLYRLSYPFDVPSCCSPLEQNLNRDQATFCLKNAIATGVLDVSAYFDPIYEILIICEVRCPARP
ncbi:uncharacterized protein HKW66_Vig0087590 [Vigna angularis]|uniref:Bifunctional inhibitor/plant lipid transfer protein/seed storage helical domain-containing protein n=1 Tax=Phaseolus angularis TaxID=3914 RepID=A0A8T0KFU9_PHAAN|nr:uncharacterized protein HKW66_Vig0087590 [Vigna angularis]